MENNGPTINEAGSLHAAIVLRACSFVLSCERAVCVRSPYSTKSRGGSQIINFDLQQSNAVFIITVIFLASLPVSSTHLCLKNNIKLKC